MSHGPIIGVDFSPACTAVSTASGMHALRTKPGDYTHRVSRMHAVSQWFGRILPDEPGVAFVEGYGYDAQHAHTLGEIGGQIRLILWLREWTIVLVPPSTLKKFATGSGKEPKDGMRMHVHKRWGYESTDNNDADAFALRAFGELMRWKIGGVGPSFASNVLAHQLECFGSVETLALSGRTEDAWASVESKPKKKKGGKCA